MMATISAAVATPSVGHATFSARSGSADRSING
jgi:hypothetical protein